MRDDADTPTVRHTAMIASTESYTRTLPPAFWYRRNAENLRKILSGGTGDTSKEFDDTLAAADNVQRAVTRDIKDVTEKNWEEKLDGGAASKSAEGAEPKKAKKAPAAAA